MEKIRTVEGHAMSGLVGTLADVIIFKAVVNTITKKKKKGKKIL